jgi:ribosomal protein S12 methylthiotransferase
MHTKGQDRVEIITLGCSKNLVDSEVLAHQLRSGGIETRHQAAEYAGQEASPHANVIVVNTCGFIDRAKEESIQTILQWAQEREKGRIDKLYVTGCLSQRYREDLSREIPEVDAWFGTLELPDLLRRFQVDYRHELVGERQPSTPRHYAYLKISEGCNRTCSFCAIPLMRGGHVSRPMEELVQEARALVSQGVREIMLIAQELTYYGLDRYKRRALPDLLRALSDVEGLSWIRLHYAYPSRFPLEVLDVMAERPNICNYLDMPLQHASDPVLRAMKRQITRAETEKLIAEARRRVPGIALRTTMLVGFPGETEADFEALMEFAAAQRFDRLGVFTYSHEEGTSGYLLDDDVPQELKEERAARLMALQEEIAESLNQQRIGQEELVLVDRIEGDFFVARSERDSPEVDNEVLLPAQEQFVRIGDFVRVRIERAEAFDCYARVIASVPA